MFAKNVKYLRKQRNISQHELAAELNYKSYTTIQKWESGITEPTLAKAMALSDFFGYKMHELTTIDLEYKDTSITELSAELEQRVKLSAQLTAVEDMETIKAIEMLISLDEPELSIARNLLFSLKKT